MEPGPARNRISDLYHQALERTPEERSAFLEEACDGDDALRGEVESLLEYESDSAELLETPAVLIAGDMAGTPDKSQMIGRELGPYAIVAPLGAGGMGEVYRARDSKLGRDVAIKILPPHFTADAERRARFRREARLLATLNHPHIGAIYGLEESDGVTALVLELVEGPTLTDRLARGPLPIPESLAIARQIAEALDAAHEKGIVHRDLKPANVVLQNSPNAAGVQSSDVRAKVLDFGLAKTMAVGLEGDLTQQPSGSLDGTAEGRILGTPAYMSPEQARGQAVDKRTDIWAFGCVVYEILTSRRAFAGDTVSDTLASVIKSDPDWSRLPAATPTGIRRLLKRCLEKNVTQRLQAIGDARLEIDDALAGREPDTPRTIDAPPTRGFRRPVPLALALALALAAVATGSIVASWLSRGSGTEANQRPLEVTQTLISVAPADRLRSTAERVESLGEGRPNRTAVALSPNGRSLVFSAVRGKQLQLYLRELDQLDATPIAGTEGGGGPFFSPDGQWVGFWANGALRKVARKGGAGSTTICETTETSLAIVGASWGSNNTIVFTGRSGRLWQVSAAGGQLSLLTKLDESGAGTEERLTTEGDTGLPSSWSPDGQALAIVRAAPESDYDIWVLPLTGDRKPYPVVKTKFRDMYPEFSPDGQWLAYSSSETGRDEVYVQRYPGPGPRYQVSSDGGIAPAWPRHGRELFYQARSEGSSEATERRKFVAVPVTTTGQTFVAGKPRVLFELTYPRTDLPVREYDVTPDGQRFLVVQEDRPPIKVTEMILVQNWVEELKKRVPTK